ncbi:MAG: glycosyltransferase [Deltaproteobacteria bacterium]|nr:MAG: glycosyltransferase [Deltaproteobacteria bacterium]
MIVLASLISILFLACLAIVFFYGLHHAFFTVFALRRPKQDPLPELEECPPVTIQITIYNEGELIEPTIHAVSQLDYPLDKLQIQLCDDSTDGFTSDICRAWQQRLEGMGYQIQHLQREDRKHHKTGNLNNALKHATGEFVALVDADFKLPPNFLKVNLPFFFEDAKVGAVQSYFTHENKTDHPLAHVMEATYGFHLLVEQLTRSNYNVWNEFNGSGGIWRRQVIDEVGGWPVAAVEDVLLSVLAQEKGWNIKFSVQSECVGLLPDSVDGYRSQQNRWAIGCGEVLRQKFWDLMKMPRSWIFKMESMFHIGGYFVYVAMTGIMSLTLPMIWVMTQYPSVAPWMQWMPLLGLAGSMGGSSILFWEANRRIGGSPLYQAIRPNLSALEQSGKAPFATWRFLMGLFGMTLKSWQSTNTKFKGVRYIWDKLYETLMVLSIVAALVWSFQLGFYFFAIPAAVYGMGSVFMLLAPFAMPGGLFYKEKNYETPALPWSALSNTSAPSENSAASNDVVVQAPAAVASAPQMEMKVEAKARRTPSSSAVLPSESSSFRSNP